MRQSVHHHYNQLTSNEQDFVDRVFDNIHDKAAKWRIPLAGNDILERAVDALARAVIESRS